MDKKSLIAIALIAALWVGYFIVFKPASPVKKPAETKVETAQKEDGEIKKGGPAPVRIEQVAGDATEKQVIVKTKKFSVTLSNRGAAITGCTYLERNIDLIVKDNPYNAKGRLDFSISFDDDEFVNGSALNSALWMLRQNGNQVTFVTDIQMNGNPVRIEKTYLFKDDGYGFTVEYRLKNNGGKVIAFKNGSAIFSPGEILGPNLNYTNSYNRLMSIYSKEGSFKKADKGGSGFLLGCGSSSSDEPLKKEAGTINWAGIMSRYFLLIMMPSEGAGKGVMYDNKKQSGFRTGMLVSLNNLDAGKEVKRTFKVYLGEKDKKKLAAMDKSLIDAADVNSLIEPIRNFVIWCLMWINKLMGNLGWSLVIFSILTKVVFMPLTIKSTESMKKMQQLAPRLNELKVKFKDKPEQMQKEMMKMYKENKVNPMGGCFPLLLQMPFFFALYSALIDSIDLWGAPFILWMKDLSMPDTVLTISGFDLNILPIVMTATTFVQQKLSTVDTGGQQKMLMMMMPLMFIFIFWSMPSGLVLYWALQNIFQIAHQLIINYRTKGEKAK
ncbi:MAG TPA: membrane protein insertase YidC [Spirochaetota bacterium]|nr:membrane protein insertase YidC [Spirochaetota bacterium]HOD13418.1 membrane protein insertase YidC [Spirochaetota bacterium]HPG49367.1 membrane protein insertase YidC [Spirochaetota bacterium]HPN10617.1 membrane protein insertase YidC [Spirochaetota bacterium]HQL80745.1 membrane protein insertase YidC [Spirochaetota bacterium]